MPASELAQLTAAAEQLSPERSPDQAMELNQRILQFDPTNAAAHVRLARAYQAQRKFAEAKAACQEALRLNPGSTVAKQRLQRISEEWELARQAQAVSSFEDALRRGVEQKADEYAGLAIAYLWRAVELSTSRWQSVQGRTALGAAYRAKKDPISLERAAAQYELVLQHVPGNLPAMTGLAAVLRDQGELSQAQQMYEQVLAVTRRMPTRWPGWRACYTIWGMKRALRNVSSKAGGRIRCVASRAPRADLARQPQPVPSEVFGHQGGGTA